MNKFLRNLSTIVCLVIVGVVSLTLTACGPKTPPEPETPEKVFEGEMLYNGFETVKDMYKVKQLYTWSFNPVCKFEIVGTDNFIPESEKTENHVEADLAPRQGNGALRVEYEVGQFSEILARFDTSELAGLPIDELAEFSIKIYNSSNEDKTVVLSLMKSENVVLSLDDARFTLAPYKWTECKVSLDPVVMEYFADQLIGLNIRFVDVSDSVYYLDDFKVKFGKVYTPETLANLEKVNNVKEKINQIKGKQITKDDLATLEELCALYNEVPQSYRNTIEDSSILLQAVKDCITALGKEESSTTDFETVGYFSSVLGVTQLSEFDGGKFEYVITDKAVETDKGSIHFEFDGAKDWVRVDLSLGKKKGFDELRVWVKNTSDVDKAFYVDWQTVKHAYDADGNEVTVKNGYVIPANSDWICLVYETEFSVTQFNVTTLINGGASPTLGTLEVGRLIFGYHNREVEDLIDTLVDYEVGYSDENRAKVLEVRKAYNNLSITTQERVKNVSKLIAIEANIWKEEFATISVATPDLLTTYTKEDMIAIENLRASYNALGQDIKKVLKEEDALLKAFEAKIEELQVAFVAVVEAQIEALDGTSKAAILAAREVYDTLTDKNKVLVTNADKLFGFEADLWADSISELPAVTDITTYDVKVDRVLEERRNAYNALADQFKDVDKIASAEAALKALEDKLARFGETVYGTTEVKVDVDGWYKVVPKLTKTSGYDEAYVYVKNNGAKKTVFQVTWNIASKAYDEEGNVVALTGGYVIPVDSGTLHLVFTEPIPWTEFNMVLFTDNNAQTGGTMDFTIERVVFIYHAPVVENMIESLDGSDPAAIQAARSAYEALSDESKTKVSNLDTLVTFEANEWKKVMASLPASPEEIVAYSGSTYTLVNDTLADYATLNSLIKAKLTTEKALLDSLKAKLDELQAAIINDIIAMIEALDGNDVEAIEAARSAYDTLSAANKALVTNADTLFYYETEIWVASLSDLPETSTVTGYDVVLARRLEAVRAIYNSLSDSLKALESVVAVNNKVTALEEKLAIYGETVSSPVHIQREVTTWIKEIPVLTKMTGYDEVHIYVVSDTNKKTAFQVNWKVPAKAFDKDGNPVAVNANCNIKANSGMLQLVYTQVLDFKEYNIVIDEGNNSGLLDFTIERVVFIYKAPLVVDMIDALDGTDAAAIQAARAAYEALSAESKAKVTNIDDLVTLEANVWKKGMVGLPASAEEVETYDSDLYATVNNLLDSYDSLSDEIKAKLTTEKALLDSLKAKLDELQAAIVNAVIDLIDALDGSSVEAIEAAREAYDTLSDANKALITNIDELVAYETEVWATSLSDLPETSTVTGYDVVLARRLEAVRARYNGLSDELKALESVVAVNNKVTALEEKLAIYGETVTSPIHIQQEVTTWIKEIPVLTKMTGYDEVHIYVSNNTDKKVAFQVNWKVPAKAFDKDGNPVAVNANCNLKANSGMLQLVYTQVLDFKEYNILIDEGDHSGLLDFTIERVVFIYKAPLVVDMIDALDGTDAAAIQAARAAYEALSNESKAKVTNIDDLVTLEANVWKKGMVGLPASAEEVETYDSDLYATVNNLLDSYDSLSDEIKAKLTTEKALLDSLKAKIELYQEEMIDAIVDMIDALDGSSVEAIVAARTAYNALSEANKALVTNADTLFGFEAAAWEDIADSVIERVDYALGWNDSIMVAIEACYEAYEALAEEVKTLVASKYACLEEAKAVMETYRNIVLNFDESASLIKSVTSDATAVYTTEEHAPNQAGSVKVTLAGTGTDINFTNVGDDFDEVHVWVKNPGASGIPFALNWNSSPKVYDVNGNALPALADKVTIPANSGWIKLVYSKASINPEKQMFSQINLWSAASGDVLYIGRITYVKNPTVVDFENCIAGATISTGTMTHVTEEHAPGQVGSLKVEVASSAHITLKPTTTSGYTELHVWVKNVGPAVAFGPDWKPCFDAYDVNGEKLAAFPSDVIIPADSGWIHLIYKEPFNITEIVLWSVDEGGNTVYIGNLVLVN